MSEETGQRDASRLLIPDHQLLKLIGQGSYGEVWLARNVMGTYRAVKVVYRDRFESDRPYEREYSGIQKFEPISRTHEGLVDVLHIGRNEGDGYFYYVMELADDALGTELGDGSAYEAKTLSREVKLRGRLPVRECLQLGMTLSGALAHLHEGGLVHRDIKPSNIIFVNGTPKLADIGLVASFSAAFSFVGTEGFIPPEGPGTIQADIYSLGKVLYECATGKDRQEFPELPTALGKAEDRQALLELNEVILKACARETAKRYRQAAELRGELEMLQAGLSVTRARAVELRLKWFSRLGLAIASVAVVALIGYLIQRKQVQTAREAREKVEVADAKASENLSQLQVEQSEAMFHAGRPSQAIATLATVLRREPTNSFVAKRIVDALTRDSFGLPTRLDDPRLISSGLGVINTNRYFEPVILSNTVVLVDARTRKPLGPILKHADRVLWAMRSPDGFRVLTGCWDQSLSLWEAATGRLIRTVAEAGTGWIKARFSGDAEAILAIRANLVAMWNSETGLALFPVVANQLPVKKARLFRNNRLTLISEDGSVHNYSMPTGQLLYELPAPQESGPIPGARPSVPGDQESPDLELQQRAHYYLTETGDLGEDGAQPSATTEVGPAGQVVFRTPQSQALPWVSGQDPPSALADALRQERGTVTCASLAPNGQEVLLGRDDGTIQVLEVPSGQPRVANMRIDSHLNWWYDGVRFSSNGQFAFALKGLLPIAAFEVLSGKCHAQRLRNVDWIEDTVLSPDATLLAVVGNSTLTVWSLSKGQKLWDTLRNPSDLQESGLLPWREAKILFSPDGRRLAALSQGRVVVWNSLTGDMEFDSSPLSRGRVDVERHQPICDIRFQFAGLHAIAISAADRREMLASLIRVEIRDLSGPGKALAAWNVDRTALRAAQFSPDGRMVMTVGQYGAIGFWDSKTGTKVDMSIEDPNPRQTPNPSRFYAFSPDGRLFALLRGSVIDLWDLVAHRRHGPPLELQQQVAHISISADSRYLLAGSYRGEVQLWDLSTGRQSRTAMESRGEFGAAGFLHDGDHVWVSSRFDFLKDTQSYLQPNCGTRIWSVHSTRPVVEALPVSCGKNRFRNGPWFPAYYDRYTAQLLEVVLPKEAPPPWLADLSEAVVGLQVGDSGDLKDVPWESRLATLDQCRKVQGHDGYSKWVKWFLADRATRTISPSALLTAPQYVEACIAENCEKSLKEALSLSPTNAAVLAALRRLGKDPVQWQGTLSGAFRMEPTYGVTNSARDRVKAMAQPSIQIPQPAASPRVGRSDFSRPSDPSQLKPSELLASYKQDRFLTVSELKEVLVELQSTDPAAGETLQARLNRIDKAIEEGKATTLECPQGVDPTRWTTWCNEILPIFLASHVEIMENLRAAEANYAPFTSELLNVQRDEARMRDRANREQSTERMRKFFTPEEFKVLDPKRRQESMRENLAGRGRTNVYQGLRASPASGSWRPERETSTNKDSSVTQ